MPPDPFHKKHLGFANVFGRSDALVERAVERAQATPERRVLWTTFREIGREIGLSEETIGATLGYCFEVFTLEVEEDGRVLSGEETADALGAAIAEPAGARAKRLSIFYKLKP